MVNAVSKSGQASSNNTHSEEADDFAPEGATFLFPPHPVDAFDEKGAKEYKPKRWEQREHKDDTEKDVEPHICDLDWTDKTEVWTICSIRRPTQARYYLQ